jgi:hypothetical protein
LLSRQIIHDVVIPIISRIMGDDGYFNPLGIDIRDQQLEEFLEEELRRRFGVIGADGCQHLKEQVEQAKKNDPFEFTETLRLLLKKYVKLQARLRRAEKMKELEKGPPDRFMPQRKKHPLLDPYQ